MDDSYQSSNHEWNNLCLGLKIQLDGVGLPPLQFPVAVLKNKTTQYELFYFFVKIPGEIFLARD